jgi:hypothetical protein
MKVQFLVQMAAHISGETHRELMRSFSTRLHTAFNSMAVIGGPYFEI